MRAEWTKFTPHTRRRAIFRIQKGPTVFAIFPLPGADRLCVESPRLPHCTLQRLAPNNGLLPENLKCVTQSATRVSRKSVSDTSPHWHR